jgi:hypothetical protein
MTRPAPPMHVRLTERIGLLEPGTVVLVPRDEGIRLVARRKGTAVGSLKKRVPDATLTREQWESATA